VAEPAAPSLSPTDALHTVVNAQPDGVIARVIGTLTSTPTSSSSTGTSTSLAGTGNRSLSAAAGATGRSQGSGAGGGQPSPPSSSLQSVEQTDSGGAIFDQIAGPASSTKVGASTISETALAALAQPSSIKSVHHSQPIPPTVTAALIPGLVDVLKPQPVPQSGVPGINYVYSNSGNSGAW
jgi:hypothetical protein